MFNSNSDILIKIDEIESENQKLRQETLELRLENEELKD